MAEANSEILKGDRGTWTVWLTQLLYYGVALLSVALALGTNLLLSPYLYPTPTPLFFAAVMVSAWYGGLKPGLLATALSTLAIHYFFVEPLYSLNIPNLGNLAQLSVFVMAAILINSLNEAQRVAQRTAEANLQSLRESAARFGRLAESNVIGIIVADLNGPILEANDIFLQMVGYTQEELRSGRVCWREMTPPESLEVSERALQELITTGTCSPFEKEYIRKDGSCVPVLHGAAMTAETTVIGFVLDLSERKRGEAERKQAQAAQQEAASRERSLYVKAQAAKEQLETVLASINDQFLVLDREWRYTYVNDRVVQVVGMSREDLLGKCIWEVFPETVGSQFYVEMHRAAAEQTIVHFEYFYSSWQRWFENHIYPSATGVSVLATEITDRKRAEETLGRTNQTLQTLIDVCPVAIAFFDSQGIVRLWNRAAEQIFGWSADEAIGQFMPTVPHRPQEFLASIQTVLSGRSLHGLEARHQRKDGQMVDLEIWANLTHDAQGNPGCLGIAWDITQRKQAEAALVAQEQRYRYIFEAVSVSIWEEDFSQVKAAIDQLKVAGVHDFHQYFAEHPEFVQQAADMVRLRDVNQAALRMFGAQDKSQLLTSLHQIFVPETQEAFIGELVAIAAEEPFFAAETVLRTLGGDRFHVWFTISFPSTSESYDRVLVSLLDMSARKRADEALRASEERFQLISQATNDVMWDYNLLTHEMWWSERVQIVFGYQPEELGPDMSGWAERVHPDDLERIHASYETYLNSGETVWTDEYRFRRADGSYADILDRAYIIRDSAGKPMRVVGAMSDITERKQAEEALRQSEERLRVALKNSPITVFNQDRDLRYTWLYNPTLEYHATQVIGKQDAELLPSEDVVVLTQIKRRVLETGVGAQQEVRLTMQGQDCYYDLKVEPLRDVDGEIIGITCASINITDRKQVELALRQSETTLSAFIASSPIGIAFFDRDLRYVHANDALAAINGVPLSEHLGRTIWEVLPEWAPVLAPVLGQVMQTKEPLLNQEVVGVTHPADVVRHGLVNYFPVCLPDGQLLGLGVTSMDITDQRHTQEALRRSEERLRISQELSLDAFTILDSVRDETGALADFVWTYVNPKAAEILQRPVKELVGQRLLEVLPGNRTNSELFERYVRVVETGEPHDLELSYNTDGVVGWFRNMAVKLEDGLAISFSDITQRKQAEAEREQLLAREQAAREQAEAANRIKDEFLAVLSHELRSPLNPILGWSKLLQTGKLDAQASHRALETIERNAKLQTQLIDDLLDVSRILRGKMALNIYPINLVTIVESALETVRLAAEAKHIQIRTVATLDNGQVSGDSARLQQIVWNLLSNAIKFTPDGGKVEIRLDQIDTYAQIQVRDTGKGINPDFLPYVFDYFRQEDGKITRKFGGLGLGLAIVRHLTELHGGTVHADSPGEGQGATFMVRFPLMAFAAASDQEISTAAQSVDLSQLRILVVDDEEDMRDLVQVILEQQGAQVTVAASAAEVLMLFDRQQPDILISDIGMPDMDGYMLMQQIRQRSPQQGGLIRAIALTAYAGEYDQRQALKVGFQKHIPKPVEPEALVNAISELMISGTSQ
jgi:PAS domain S-box-containing protein